MLLFICIILLLVNLWCLKLVLSLPNGTPNKSSVSSVLVVLPVRNAENTFSETIRSLLSQDYGGPFSLRIVVDSPEDAAWKAIEEVNDPRVDPVLLEQRGEQCSLKCSALIAQAESCQADFMVVLDSDLNPPPDWLSQMIGAFSDPDLGAVCALRYYAPGCRSFSGTLQHIWSVGAVMQTVASGVFWGGSAAYRRECLPDLAARWQTSITEDVVVPEVVAKAGWKWSAVQVVVKNTPSLDFKSLCDFIIRQCWLLRVDGNWWPIAIGSWFASVFFVAALVFSPATAILYWLGLALIGTYLTSHLHGSPPIPLRKKLYSMLLCPLLPLLTACCCLFALKRRICWRGVWYAKSRRIGSA